MRRLDDRVRLQEATEHGVIQPPIHVNDAELRQMLVPGEAALIDVERTTRVSRVPPRPEAVEGDAAERRGAGGAHNHHLRHHAAEVIFEHDAGDRRVATERRQAVAYLGRIRP